MHAKGSVVTAAVKSMNFKVPLYISVLISLYAEIVERGKSSITVDVDVWIERNTVELETLNVANARLVFVDVDEQGKVRSLPKMF